jgi:hypothetical protein
VQTAGIAIGQIDKRELHTSGKAKITIRMKPEIVLYEGAAVSKKSASLLGEYYLEIYAGDPFVMDKGVRRPARVLKDGDQILIVHEPTAMNDIVNDVATLLPIMREILEDVRKLTSGTITDIATNDQHAHRVELGGARAPAEPRRSHRRERRERHDDRGRRRQAVYQERPGDHESIKSLIGTTQGEVSGTGGAMRRLDRQAAVVDRPAWTAR